jgi:hypothetical protein
MISKIASNSFKLLQKSKYFITSTASTTNFYEFPILKYPLDHNS